MYSFLLIPILMLTIFGCSSSSLISNNSKNKISFYGSLFDKGNNGLLLLSTKHSEKDILNIKKDPESSYLKVFYRNNNHIQKIEKYTGNQIKPNTIYFINNNNINDKISYLKKNERLNCFLTYKNKNTLNIKTTLCSDGTKQILITKLHKYFISKLKYNKNGKLIEKEISTKRGIEHYKNNKLIEIKNEID